MFLREFLAFYDYDYADNGSEGDADLLRLMLIFWRWRCWCWWCWCWSPDGQVTECSLGREVHFANTQMPLVTHILSQKDSIKTKRTKQRYCPKFLGCSVQATFPPGSRWWGPCKDILYTGKEDGVVCLTQNVLRTKHLCWQWWWGRGTKREASTNTMACANTLAMDGAKNTPNKGPCGFFLLVSVFLSHIYQWCFSIKHW